MPPLNLFFFSSVPASSVYFFFAIAGNPANEDMCSKCARDRKRDTPPTATAAVAAAAAPSPVTQPSVGLLKPVTVEAAEEARPPPSDGESPPKRLKLRCAACNKKVGLLGFTCRCSMLLCPQHRHADNHSCSFDYKEFDRSNLEKVNIRVVKDKLERI